MSDDDLKQQAAEIWKQYEIHRKAEERAWAPAAASMEALVLKILGGWEMLKAEVNWAYFHWANVQFAGPDSPPDANAHDMSVTISHVAEGYNVRWPGEDWSATYKKVAQVRHKLAHLLYVFEVDNESSPPNRKLEFMRIGTPGQKRKRFGEFRVLDDVWSRQDRYLDTVTAKELADALDATTWLVDCVRSLKRLEQFLNDEHPWPDDYVIPGWERDFLVWWFPDWGDRETAVITAGQLRVTPLAGPTAS